MEILATIVFFGLCMVGLSIGVILSDRRLRGSCGGDALISPDGEAISCGACPKKEQELCPSDDDLIRLAQLSHPDPRHHH